MRKTLILLAALSGLATAQDGAVHTFYSDWERVFRKAGGNPNVGITQGFLRDHQDLIEPKLYADWMKAEEYLSDGRHTRGVYWEYDPITGSSGMVLKGLTFGKATEKGVPVSFHTTDMRDRPMQRKIVVAVRGGKISDIDYGGGSPSLRASIDDVLKLPLLKP